MKRILFVCVENSCRSQIAEAYVRMHKVAGVKAYSAGSHPSGVVNRKAIQAMQELGYDLDSHQSKSLTDLPDLVFDVVVTMGCGDDCPAIRAEKREDWQIPDPKHMGMEEFLQVRNLIGQHVENLLSALDNRQ